MYTLSTNMYLQGIKMDPLGTNMFLLKRYRPSDSFCTFISECTVSEVLKCWNVLRLWWFLDLGRINYHPSSLYGKSSFNIWPRTCFCGWLNTEQFYLFGWTVTLNSQHSNGRHWPLHQWLMCLYISLCLFGGWGVIHSLFDLSRGYKCASCEMTAIT